MKDWTTRKAAELTCPNGDCRARYTVTEVKLPQPEEDYALCWSCGVEMARWSGSIMPLFRAVPSYKPPQ